MSVVTMNGITKIAEQKEVATDLTLEVLDISSASFDYYLKNEEDVAMQVETDYGHLANIFEESQGLFTDSQDTQDINSAKSNLEETQILFSEYIALVADEQSEIVEMAEVTEEFHAIALETLEAQEAEFMDSYHVMMGKSSLKASDFEETMVEYKEVDKLNHIVEYAIEMTVSQMEYSATGSKSADDGVYANEALAKQYIQELEDIFVEDSEKALLVPLRAEVDKFMAVYEDYKSILQAQDTNFYAAEDLVNGGLDKLGALEVKYDELQGNKISQGRLITILLGISGMIIGILLALYIATSTVRQLSKSTEEMYSAADQVASAAGQIASTSQQLSAGTQEQASSVEEMSSITETTNEMTRQNTSNTVQAAQLTQEAQKSAQEGSEQMSSMKEAMSNIQASSSEIAKIMKVIDEIAFQTNILALNAAVEAARAGEAGAGFAVVADEVKNLATRSQEAAQNSAQIVDDNIKLSQDGVTASNKVDEVLISINNQIDKVTVLMSEVSEVSKQQEEGMNQLATSISEVEKVTQENAAGAEETAAAGEELTAQSDMMMSAIDTVNKLVSGNSNHQQAVVSAPARTVAMSQTRRTTTIKTAPSQVLPLEDDMSDF